MHAASRSAPAPPDGTSLRTSLLDHLSDFVAVLDEQGSIIYANDAVVRLFGQGGSATSIARQRLHPDDVDTVVTAFAEVLSGTRSPREPFRYRMFAPDGTVRLLEAWASDQRHEPAIGGLLMVMRDVTVHEEVAAEHRTRSSQLAALLAALSDAVLFIDDERRIVFVNEAFGEMFRIDGPVSELIGRCVTEDLRAAAGERAEKPERFGIDIETTYEEGQPRTLEVELADGRVLEARYMPVRRFGEGTGHLWVYRDISERRRGEQMKDEFVASVSHELRTPLTSVLAFTDFLLDGADTLTDEQQEYLAVIRRNTDRLMLHVSDLLLIAQIERGGYRLYPEPVDLRRMIECVVDSLRPRAAEADVTLQIRTSPGPALVADPDRIEQVLVNLCSNAIKFNRRDGKVFVDACCDGDTWTIAVTDTGVGIPEAEQDRLFERFYRASNARDARTPGTGLGLAISRVIVELHGGTIRAESTLGEGTTVSVRLPVRGGAPAGDD